IPLLKILEVTEVIPAPGEEIKEAVNLLTKLKDEYGASKPLRTNLAKQMAKKLLGKTPIIFGTTGITGAVALRFKTQLNENSKVTALFNLFPELNHNEIVNLYGLKRDAHNFVWLIFRDEVEPERVKKRIEITKSLLVRQLGGCHEVFSQGKFSLAKVLSLIMFGDFLSVYLAVLQGIDPTPVEAIMRFKKEMLR
ncbi:MAG: SIS domain-containing protein, partial [Candidatus Margulisiibacteriota bacterium]